MTDAKGELWKSWFRGEWGTTIREIIAEADPSIFDRQAIEGRVRAKGDRIRNAHRLFALVIFELWRLDYGAAP
jgi:hypothetical protein